MESEKQLSNYFIYPIKLYPSNNPKPTEKYLSSPTRIKALEIAFKKKVDEKKVKFAEN